MGAVEVALARADERHVLTNMMQFYVHDFSEHWSGRADGDLLDDGRFPDYPLDPYWRDDAHIPLLLRQDRRLVGFALLNGASHTGERVERNMAEFFIARKYRRGGVGTQAAQAIFSRYPGAWEAAVARRNVGALAFWRRAVTSHPRAADIDERDISSDVWNGPVIRFRIRRAD